MHSIKQVVIFMVTIIIIIVILIIMLVTLVIIMLSLIQVLMVHLVTKQGLEIIMLIKHHLKMHILRNMVIIQEVIMIFGIKLIILIKNLK